MRPTQALLAPGLRRLPLTTKSARKGYYKGTGVGILGRWDPVNPRKFILDWNKIKTYKTPDPSKTIYSEGLTPFVTKRLSPYVEKHDGTWAIPEKKLTGEQYLKLWKDAGGEPTAA